MQRTYLAIDLKSYYASAECAARHLDPLTTNLVVADSSRTEKTICLAVSPSLKAYGIPGRARLFEVVQKVKEVNANRLREAVRLRKAMYKDGNPSFSSASYDSLSLAADPSLEISYLVAPPRMAYYEKVSRQIYGIYLKYIAPEDIVVYSIDEVFIDATSYLSHYNMTAHDLAMTMIREVLYTTGITATAGIGTNLYLAKLAMDITAKHAAPDKDGVTQEFRAEDDVLAVELRTHGCGVAHRNGGLNDHDGVRVIFHDQFDHSFNCRCVKVLGVAIVVRGSSYYNKVRIRVCSLCIQRCGQVQFFLCKILLNIIILNWRFMIVNHIHFRLHNVNSHHLIMLC